MPSRSADIGRLMATGATQSLTAFPFHPLGNEERFAVRTSAELACDAPKHYKSRSGDHCGGAAPQADPFHPRGGKCSSPHERDRCTVL
jgi:hypothetical protein